MDRSSWVALGALCVTLAVAASDLPVLTVDVAAAGRSVRDYALAANHRDVETGYGMLDPQTGAVRPDFVAKTKGVMGALRWPGGTIGNLVRWKETLGPVSNRVNQTIGNWQKNSVVPYYGLNEHLAYCEQIGAKPFIMITLGIDQAADAADLVEYLNAPNDGSNPNGGIDWAAVRASYGHPAPYGVKYFEIGNEMWDPGQRYWMGFPSAKGPNKDWHVKFAKGDTVQMKGVPLSRPGHWDDQTVAEDGLRTFTGRHRPFVEGSVTVRVNGKEWKRVASLEKAGPDDAVYLLDCTAGKVTFGDGRHGRAVKKGDKLRFDAQHPHDGFTAFYAKMKAVDPSIVVVSCVGDIWDYLPDRTKCDGVAVHTYRPFRTEKSKRGVYDAWIRIGDNLAASFAKDIAKEKARAKRDDIHVLFTEYGVIGIPATWTKAKNADGSDNQLAREEARILPRALHFASAMIGAINADVELLSHQGYTAHSWGGGPDIGSAGKVYNCLFSVDGTTKEHTIPSAMGETYVLFSHLRGGAVLPSSLAGNPAVKGVDSPALRTLAVRLKSGRPAVLVVNCDPEEDVKAEVRLNGGKTEKVRAFTLNAKDWLAFNSPEHPDDVKVTESTPDLPAEAEAISYTFPAHSVTLLQL